jgi:glycosyltransferase involved in cell wall biosynthesis
LYRNHKIGIAVPAFNEELLIQETIKNALQYGDRVYVVNDASTDATAEKIQVISDKDERCVFINLATNQGVGGAIITAFKHAIKDEMDIICVMAGDNQMEPKYLPLLLDPIIDDKIGFTKGNRLKKGFRKGMSAFRKIGNFILSYMNKIVSGYWHLMDPQNGYVAFSRECLEKLHLDQISKGYTFENDIMIKTNVENIAIRSVSIPANYGNEVSTLNYPSFIMRTLLFFAKSFIWRIYKKYIIKFNPIGYFYLLSPLLIIAGIPLLFFGIYSVLPIGLSLFILACVIEIIQSKKLS